MTIDLVQTELTRIRAQMHDNCVVCSHSNERGLGLEFALSEDGSVQAAFNCDKSFEGYADMLHGGVISSLLDGAMTSCMFAHGCATVTVQLNIRFRHPVVTNKLATVRAWIDRSSPPLYMLKAEILQDQQVKATAAGKFMEQFEASLREIR